MKDRLSPTIPAHSMSAVASTVASTALSAERAMAVARILFFGAILLQFLWYSQLPLAGMLITAFPLIVGIAFSIFVLVGVETPPRGEWLWLISITIDATACFTSLLPSVLWPTDVYRRVIDSPDTLGIFVAMSGAGFRLSPKAAVWGGLLNVASITTLVAVDRVVSGARFETSAQTVSLIELYIAAVAFLAILLAVLTRRLVLRSAMAAMRADRAEQGLGSVLADHHDLRSMLASVTLKADMLARAMSGSPGEGGDDGDESAVCSSVRTLARTLCDEIERVNEVVENVKGRALTNLGALCDLAEVELRAVAQSAIDVAQTRYEDVRIRLASVAQETRV